MLDFSHFNSWMQTPSNVTLLILAVMAVYDIWHRIDTTDNFIVKIIVMAIISGILMVVSWLLSLLF